MAESDRSGRRTGVTPDGGARQGGARGAPRPGASARKLKSEEPAGGLLSQVREVQTRRGPARTTLDLPASAPSSLLVLGHGAGGEVDAPDLVAITEAAVSAGVAVVRVTQPYRVAGRRAPAPANHLDEAWTDVVHELERGVPLLVGGRSSGARVACRTASALGAAGVVALAFPTHPPGKPERTRVDELPTELPVLVVNGDRDPFGIPPVVSADMTLQVVPGADHGLKKFPDVVAGHVVTWLRDHHWA